MNRQDKAQSIQSLKDGLQKEATFIVGYKGLTVAQLTDLRRKLHKDGGSMQVAKVTLMERAISEGSSAEQLKQYLQNQIAFVYAEKNSPAIAKVLSTYAKENEKLQLIAGYLENQVISTAGIKAVASLPPREVLLAILCGTLNAPSQKLVMMLNLMVVRLLYVLQQAADKKEQEAAA
ncbi:50S ribosomal protein L10 [Candidatus Dependentiae bacterium]|nr:50S ribosomal protein L10 [Candidatus Dependentiae bacterium]